MADEAAILRTLQNIERLLGRQGAADMRPAHERPLQANTEQITHLVAGGGGPSRPFEVVDFFRDNLNTPTGIETFILIDKDNAGGNYNHRPDGRIVLAAAAAHIVKIKANDSWEAALCVVLRVDATDADMAILEFNSLHANDTTRFQNTRDTNLYPLELDLAIVNEKLFHVVPSQVILADPTVNTTLGLEDAVGDVIAPGVGDVLIRTTRVMGNGAAQVEFSAWYRKEP